MSFVINIAPGENFLIHLCHKLSNANLLKQLCPIIVSSLYYLRILDTVIMFLIFFKSQYSAIGNSLANST